MMNITYKEFNHDEEKPSLCKWMLTCVNVSVTIILCCLVIVLLACIFTPSLLFCDSFKYCSETEILARLLYDSFCGFALQMWFVINASFLLPVKTLWKLHIIHNHVIAGLLDFIYRSYLQQLPVQESLLCVNWNLAFELYYQCFFDLQIF